jgi:hypothetical protein
MRSQITYDKYSFKKNREIKVAKTIEKSLPTLLKSIKLILYFFLILKNRKIVIIIVTPEVLAAIPACPKGFIKIQSKTTLRTIDTIETMLRNFVS